MKKVSTILKSIDNLIQEVRTLQQNIGETQSGTPPPKVTVEKPKISGSDPSSQPRSYELLNWEEKLKGGYKVKFRTGSKLITIFRFLLAKVVYDKLDGLRLDEYLALMEAYLRLREHKDPTFQAKYGEWLITIQPFLASLAGIKVFPMVPQKSSHELERALTPLLPSVSAYFGYKNNPQIRDSFRIIVRNPFITAKSLPPPRFLGVGYKDKGHRRNTAIDGSPRWQDIAGKDIPTSVSPSFEASEFRNSPTREKMDFDFMLEGYFSNLK